MTQKQIIEKIIASKNMSPRKLGLRFDRVALRLVNEIETTSTPYIPIGKILLVSIIAPVRLPGKTSLEINEKIANHFLQKNQQTSFAFESCTNHVRIRLVKIIGNKKLKFVGFVHNRNVNAVKIFDLIEEYLSSSL